MPQLATIPHALQRPDLTPIPRLLLSREEAALAIGLSVRELDDLTAPKGPIRCVRCGRRVLFAPTELQRWIADQLEIIDEQSAEQRIDVKLIPQ